MTVDGAIKVKKKKKKVKEDKVRGAKDYHHTSVQTTGKTECSEVKICEEEDQHEHEPSQTKRQDEKAKENDFVALCCDASAQTSLKTEELEVNFTEIDQEKSDVPQREKKKKKKKKMMEANISEAGRKVTKDSLDKSGIKKVKKKRDKPVEAIVPEAREIKKKKKKSKKVEIKDKEVDVGHNGSLEKKKKKQRTTKDQEQNPELEDEEVKKKRKKIEKNSTTDERDACIMEEQTKKKKKKKEKITSLMTESNAERMEVNEKKVEVKKKKKKKLSVEKEVYEVNTKKKKWKKRSESEDVCVKWKKGKTGDVIDETGDRQVMSSDQKMIKNIKLEDDVVVETMEKKRRTKDKSKTTEKNDVMFLSAKNGNQDEVFIDQARRVALQKEIDQESQPKLFNSSD